MTTHTPKLNLTIGIIQKTTELSICCQKEIAIRLMPDYSSSGLWCFYCGCGTGQPKFSYPELPIGLIQTIEMWNSLWEYRSDGTVHYVKDYFKDMFVESGRYLCEQINQYYPCYFDCDEKVIFYDLDNLKE